MKKTVLDPGQTEGRAAEAKTLLHGAEACGEREPVIRKAITVTGWVQGVGFRWRARSAADALGVTGWIRNDRDGSVSMELQGTQAQIDGVLRAVERGTYVRIEDLRVKTLPSDETERCFRVLDDA